MDKFYLVFINKFCLEYILDSYSIEYIYIYIYIYISSNTSIIDMVTIRECNIYKTVMYCFHYSNLNYVIDTLIKYYLN